MHAVRKSVTRKPSIISRFAPVKEQPDVASRFALMHSQIDLAEVLAADIVETVQDLQESDVYSNNCYEDDTTLRIHFKRVYESCIARLQDVKRLKRHFDDAPAYDLSHSEAAAELDRLVNALKLLQEDRNDLRQRIRRRQFQCFQQSKTNQASQSPVKAPSCDASALEGIMKNITESNEKIEALERSLKVETEHSAMKIEALVKALEAQQAENKKIVDDLHDEDSQMFIEVDEIRKSVGETQKELRNMKAASKFRPHCHPPRDEATWVPENRGELFARH